MKHLFLPLLALCLLSCAQSPETVVEPNQKSFALSFFKHVDSLTPAHENVVVSPYSAAVALSMLAEGAQGETREEFDKALGGILYKSSNLEAEGIIVNSANSVWVDEHFKPAGNYSSLLESDYDASLHNLNFADPVAIKTINNWCSDHTNGKITEILDRLDPGNVMVLINALYFNAPWENEFNQSLTQEMPFYGLNRESKVRMMRAEAEFPYAVHHGFQIIQLPYKGLRYSMYIVLPPKDADINKLLPKASTDVFQSALDALTMQKVRLFLPSFKAETSMLLNQPLQIMGIKKAFTSAADFSGISPKGDLALDQVKQKCFIEVSEKGTEAAAVTSAQIRLTSARPVAQLPIMRVDRPFAFLIADEDNILFAGKIVNL